ncbi:MAG: hypothetical protein ACD_41C00258G0003 [uncultured bacterium]|nr:MAG: hypothetical protein ACD_41C00258G0003 [uncultured bacterium]
MSTVTAGKEVVYSGRMFTARDKAHKWLLQHDFKPLHGAVIYHCGPLYQEQPDGSYQILAAGPTTSARFNLYTPRLIKKYRPRMIIGKGGMDDTVRQALKGVGVYCAAIGGAAVYYAHCITKVIHVYKKDFGMTDAIWELEVKDFPVICMMDSAGKSLYAQVEKQSYRNRKKFI